MSASEESSQAARVRESVTRIEPDRHGLVDPPTGEHCLYCGEDVSHPAVHWSGVNGQEIFLHADCPIHLSVRILRDAHEIQNPAYYERRKQLGLE